MEQITLCANDEPSFRKIVDVLNDCFGKNYVGYQRSIWNINSEEMAWFPQISPLKQDGYHSTGNHGWINYTEDNWDHIFEECHTFSNTCARHDNHRVRYVFAKDKTGAYIFRGKYKCDEAESTSQKWIYKRISTTATFTY